MKIVYSKPKEKEKDLREEIVEALDGIRVIRLTFKEKHWKPVWSDNENYINGWDEESDEVIVKDFDSEEKCDDFIGELSVTEGESEGSLSYKLISREVVWKPKENGKSE